MCLKPLIYKVFLFFLSHSLYLANFVPETNELNQESIAFAAYAPRYACVLFHDLLIPDFPAWSPDVADRRTQEHRCRLSGRFFSLPCRIALCFVILCLSQNLGTQVDFFLLNYIVFTYIMFLCFIKALC